MGIPTVAAYVIGASVVGPVLINLGLQPLAAHMFVFYFAVISGITPPVCAAVYPAAALAHARWIQVAWVAVRLCAASYVVPFVFTVNLALLMQGEPLNILLSTAVAVVGVVCLAAGAFGYMLKPTTVFERILLIACGLLLLYPDPVSRVAGFGLLAIILLKQVYFATLCAYVRRGIGKGQMGT